jgi:hypothetical protein
MKKKVFQFFLLVSLFVISSLTNAATEPNNQTSLLPQTLVRLMHVAKHSPPSLVNSRVSSEAISLYKNGKTTAPIAVIAVSSLLGEKSPAVEATLAGVIRAGANPSLMVAAGKRAGMEQKEIFVAVLEGGVDPTTITSSTAAGLNNNENSGNKASAAVSSTNKTDPAASSH